MYASNLEFLVTSMAREMRVSSEWTHWMLFATVGDETVVASEPGYVAD